MKLTPFAAALAAVVLLAAQQANVVPAAAATHNKACAKPNDPIAIKSVRISESEIRPGDTVSGTIVATCNVAAVTAQVGTFRVGVPKVAPGLFQTSVQVPRTMFPGNFTLTITAIRSDGFSIHSDLPIVLRW